MREHHNLVLPPDVHAALTPLDRPRVELLVRDFLASGAELPPSATVPSTMLALRLSAQDEERITHVSSDSGLDETEIFRRALQHGFRLLASGDLSRIDPVPGAPTETRLSAAVPNAGVEAMVETWPGKKSGFARAALRRFLTDVEAGRTDLVEKPTEMAHVKLEPLPRRVRDSLRPLAHAANLTLAEALSHILTVRVRASMAPVRPTARLDGNDSLIATLDRYLSLHELGPEAAGRVCEEAVSRYAEAHHWGYYDHKLPPDFELDEQATTRAIDVSSRTIGVLDKLATLEGRTREDVFRQAVGVYLYESGLGFDGDAEHDAMRAPAIGTQRSVARSAESPALR